MKTRPVPAKPELFSAEMEVAELAVTYSKDVVPKDFQESQDIPITIDVGRLCATGACPLVPSASPQHVQAGDAGSESASLGNSSWAVSHSSYYVAPTQGPSMTARQ
ncbi:hypothetical protein GQ457_06G007650 [Hibiscus cannabinus]